MNDFTRTHIQITKKLLEAGRDDKREWIPKWDYSVRSGSIYMQAVSETLKGMPNIDCYAVSFMSTENFNKLMEKNNLQEKFLEVYEKMVDDFINEEVQKTEGEKMGPEKIWKKIDDKNIKLVWFCDSDCNESGNRVEISPSFLQENGTPVCDNCDADLEYDHAEILEG